ncbi:carbohydrate-binding protein [Saccharopolyspora elongata]|uniref:Carbohydrate-binding protein n=1 Tax=Saccharopolyspora elongata TaxID=2530387 RepID=A0A4R4Z868_9PSEU|nr:carbohydrate-binding protein [Saccharopolyspora elongata]
MSDQVWVCDGCNTNNAAEAAVCRRCKREPGSTTSTEVRLASDEAVTPRRQDTEPPDTSTPSLSRPDESATPLSRVRVSSPDSSPASRSGSAPEDMPRETESSAPVESSRPSRRDRRTLAVVGVLIVLVIAGLIALLASLSLASLSVATNENHSGPTSTVPTSSFTFPPSASAWSAYGGLDAESFDWQSGGIAVNQDGYIGPLSRGDSIRFTNVDFGSVPATEVSAQLWTWVGDGVNAKIDVRLDGPEGKLIGKINVSPEKRREWKNVPVKLVNGPVTGKHTVYLTFVADKPEDFMYLNWIQFHR